MRGTQFAEQMAGEDRTSVLDTALLLVALCFVMKSNAVYGVLTLLLERSSAADIAVLSKEGALLELLEHAALTLRRAVHAVFPLLAYAFVVEILLGVVGRVTRRGCLGAELAPHRLIAALLFLLLLSERIFEVTYPAQIR